MRSKTALVVFGDHRLQLLLIGMVMVTIPIFLVFGIQNNVAASYYWIFAIIFGLIIGAMILFLLVRSNNKKKKAFEYMKKQRGGYGH